MGYTIYYRTSIKKWREFSRFIKRICAGIGWDVRIAEERAVIEPPCDFTEKMVIEKEGEGFVKTNLVEPCHSICLLLLHAAASFGSVSVWED